MPKAPLRYDGSTPDNEPSGDDEKSMSSTAVLPKSILAGKDFKVGDEVVLKITALHGDEVEVEYAPAEPEETPPEDETTPEDGSDGTPPPEGEGGGEEAAPPTGSPGPMAPASYGD